MYSGMRPVVGGVVHFPPETRFKKQRVKGGTLQGSLEVGREFQCKANSAVSPRHWADGCAYAPGSA